MTFTSHQGESSMRKMILLIILIIVVPSLARSQTSFKNSVSSQNESSRAYTRRCMGWQLSVKHVADDAGAGQRAVTYAFTNTSSRPCTLSGYPGFVLLNRAGRRLRGVHIVRTGDPAQVVTLAPGGNAWFNITYSSCSVGGTPPCLVSAKVRITAPGTTRHFVLPEKLDPFEGRINLSPVLSSQP
jgi:Protein of unknown function (DUF4232)